MNLKRWHFLNVTQYLHARYGMDARMSQEKKIIDYTKNEKRIR